jgi:hypothetical protein
MLGGFGQTQFCSTTTRQSGEALKRSLHDVETAQGHPFRSETNVVASIPFSWSSHLVLAHSPVARAPDSQSRRGVPHLVSRFTFVAKGAQVPLPTSAQSQLPSQNESPWRESEKTWP